MSSLDGVKNQYTKAGTELLERMPFKPPWRREILCLTQQEELIDLATSGSSSDRRNHRVSRRPLRKGRQRGSHSIAQSAGLPWVCRGRISTSCNRTEHPGCFRGILALSAVGLGDRLVEYRHRNPRHRGRLILVSLCRSQTVVGCNRGSCAWIRPFLSVFSQRPFARQRSCR